MAMEEALLARLRGATTLEPLTGDRIDWYDRPRFDHDAQIDTLPAISLTPVSPGEEWTHDGPDGLDEARVRFECWGRTKAEAVAVKRALRTEMHALRDVSGWRFHPASLETARGERDDGNDGDVPLFRETLDFLFYHEEL